MCSYSNLLNKFSRSVDDAPPLSDCTVMALTSAEPILCLHFHYALWACHPKTRICARLLGPCFKTGRLKPFCQHLKRVCDVPQHSKPLRPTALQVVQQDEAAQARLAQSLASPVKRRKRHAAPLLSLPAAVGKLAGYKDKRLTACPPSHLSYPTAQTDVDSPYWYVNPTYSHASRCPGL